MIRSNNPDLFTFRYSTYVFSSYLVALVNDVNTMIFMRWETNPESYAKPKERTHVSPFYLLYSYTYYISLLNLLNINVAKLWKVANIQSTEVVMKDSCRSRVTLNKPFFFKTQAKFYISKLEMRFQTSFSTYRSGVWKKTVWMKYQINSEKKMDPLTAKNTW